MALSNYQALGYKMYLLAKLQKRLSYRPTPTWRGNPNLIPQPPGGLGLPTISDASQQLLWQPSLR
jgi:hypothetical protein